MRQRLPWILPLVFSSWIVLSFASLFMWGNDMPVLATNLLSVAFLPFLVLLPLMRPLGLVMGDIFSAPTVGGFVLGMLLCNAALFGIGKWIQKRLGRS
jgi:hypothetical protein